ncbi:MAG: hypothetical protein IKP05_01200 [Alphaproteobacteria bacterium]|nr:hypothetical protein [Alphaproteobacteria bacterium]
MRVLTIVQDDGITGVRYGMLEVSDKASERAVAKKLSKQYENTKGQSMTAICHRTRHK